MKISHVSFLCAILLLALAASASDSTGIADRTRVSGDVDNDGDVDVVEARTQDWTASGHVPYRVLVNANGVLADRTEALATDSGLRHRPVFDADNPMAHLTLSDLDNDGWLDLVVAAKRDELPWIYLNRCCSVGGCDVQSCSKGEWLGLGLVEDRVPEMMSVKMGR